MSVAALQAIALRDAVAADRVAPESRYLCAASRLVDPAWQLTAAADLALPSVPGPRPVSTRAINAYLRRLLAAAERDPDLAAAFLRVITMLDPPTALLHPMIIRRTLRRRRPRTPPPDVNEARRLDMGRRAACTTAKDSQLRYREAPSAERPPTAGMTGAPTAVDSRRPTLG